MDLPSVDEQAAIVKYLDYASAGQLSVASGLAGGQERQADAAVDDRSPGSTPAVVFTWTVPG
ncbi:hypothetical protein QE364_002737 [Nocardioides zeae]|uniref:Uncharacterized protein n=1 Tax=Nocardioides zeae TaxID=1457234 RepID=A0ACC6IK65_9ACTN|nr:hypothetical protein [Nocardioides zeae]MDR6211018.1 hypothetical protein [Nocardioides zeae]